jgi:hypothetical protein
MIPYEQFYKRCLSSLTHLRVLGSTCYYSLPGNKSKLDARKGQAILLGYNSDGRGPTAAYKLYDVMSKRVITSTDVIIDERPASNNGVTEALRPATVPPPPGVVIHIPSTHAQNVPDTSTTSVQPAVVPASAIHSPAVASANPQSSIVPHATQTPAQNQGELSADPQYTYEAPRRSARPNKGIPAVTFASGLIAECGLAMLDNSTSPWLSGLTAQGKKCPPINL